MMSPNRPPLNSRSTAISVRPTSAKVSARLQRPERPGQRVAGPVARVVEDALEVGVTPAIGGDEQILDVVRVVDLLDQRLGEIVQASAQQAPLDQHALEHVDQDVEDGAGQHLREIVRLAPQAGRIDPGAVGGERRRPRSSAMCAVLAAQRICSVSVSSPSRLKALGT